ncbi:MAG TPA: ATP-binding protein [Thermoanaerobaculia bacterium]|nr:ATP-binding protein [Thermoanaerobaculia bacterium]
MDRELGQRIPSTLAALERAAAEVRQFLAREGVDREASFAVDLALEEIGSNIILHGLGGAADHEIGVRVRVEPGRVVLVVDDDGPPFDPTAQPPPALDLSLDERPIGGLGIHLVTATTTSAGYSRIGGRNTLELVVAR